MPKDEERLLGNMLDSLDRVYDRDCGVADVYALLFATARALAGSETQAQIELVLPKLLAIIRSVHTGQERRDAALAATDDLRKILARKLPFNPC
jgi:hypothetical protein